MLILLVLVILVVLVRESPLLAGLLLLRQEKSEQLSLYRSTSYLSYTDSHIYCYWFFDYHFDNCVFYQCDIRTWVRKCSVVSSADDKFTWRRKIMESGSWANWSHAGSQYFLKDNIVNLFKFRWGSIFKYFVCFCYRFF